MKRTAPQDRPKSAKPKAPRPGLPATPTHTPAPPRARLYAARPVRKLPDCLRPPSVPRVTPRPSPAAPPRKPGALARALRKAEEGDDTETITLEEMLSECFAGLARFNHPWSHSRLARGARGVTRVLVHAWLRKDDEARRKQWEREKATLSRRPSPPAPPAPPRTKTRQTPPRPKATPKG